MNLRRCAGHLVLCLTALLVAGGAQAQLSISNYEFSSVAVDYPAGGSVPNSLQGSLGQTMVTVDPPTNTGQNLAFLGFWETGVKFRYIGDVELESFLGNPSTLPLTIRFWNTTEENNDTVTVTMAADGTFVADSWMNPAHVAAMSAKTTKHLRRRLAPTIPADPLAYPSVNYTGATQLLRGGDADNSNLVDVLDLNLLVQSFDADPSSPNWLNGKADFNGDDLVDVLDLALIIRNFDQEGDE